MPTKLFHILIDTNLVNPLAPHPTLRRLEDLQRQGLVKVHYSSRAVVELSRWKKLWRGFTMGQLAIRRLRKGRFRQELEPGVIGRSFIGKCRIVSDEEGKELEAMFNLMKGKRPRSDSERDGTSDLLHAFTMLGADCEYFVTDDKKFARWLRKRRPNPKLPSLIALQTKVVTSQELDAILDTRF